MTLHPESRFGNSVLGLPSALEVEQEVRALLSSPLFRQAPKLCALLEYVCRKALLHEGAGVTEYTIALDVFGKSSDFKERKDSSVRVEVHRLRKRLAQFYETEGREHPIRVVIPQGHYAPEFLPQSERADGAPEFALPPPASDASIHGPAEEQIIEPSPAHRRPAASPAATPTWAAPAAVFAILAAMGGWAWTSLNQKEKPSTHLPAQASIVSAPPVASSTTGPIRILAGYAGPPQRDVSGAEWGPDLYFQGGRPSHRDTPPIGRTNNPFLFQNSRIGDCTYDVPLPPGTYELHLYFVEPEYGPEVGRGENDRTFFLHLNDSRLVPAIDIESDAMGPNIADERVFKEVHPGNDGKLHIGFESATGVPLVNAIEILPGLPHAQLPVRLGAHPVPFTDHLGQVWQADNYYLNGQRCPRNQGVAGTLDPALFALERYGHFDYAIPVDLRGEYTVKLYFAEFYFGPSAPGRGGDGSRVFNIMCNGVLLFPNLDIFKEAGNSRALTKTAYRLKPTAQGKLNLTFEPVVNYALIDGIEVLDESN